MLTKLLNTMDKQNRQPVKDTEQLILDAAIKEFSTKGFDGARTAAIAAEAGVTHAMLHYYFRTKEKLFERIFQDKIKHIINMVFITLISSDRGIKERISKSVEAHFDFLLENPEIPKFFITAINSRPDLYNYFMKGIVSTASGELKTFQSELDKAHAAGEMAKIDAGMLICDIASLNVMPFLSYPIMMGATGYSPEEYDKFMSARKKESMEIIMKRIS